MGDHVRGGVLAGKIWWAILLPGALDTTTMAGFDDPGVYYSDAFLPDDRSEVEGEISRTAAIKRFKEFLKTFLDRDNCFCYR